MSIFKILVIHYNVMLMYFIRNNQNMEKYTKDYLKSGRLFVLYMQAGGTIKKCSNFCKKMVGCK